MSKQTALQWLLEQWPILESQLPSSIIDEALEMEREQRIDFAKKCLDKSLDLDIRTVHSKVEEYYNKTYGGQDESNH
jgi:hypothetical protein